MLPITTSRQLKKENAGEYNRVDELEAYFDRIRMAIVLAGSDPYLIRESVERQLKEMEDIFNEIKDSTTL